MRIIDHGSRWLEEFPASRWRWLAAPLWLPWRGIVAARNLAYDHGRLAVHRLPVPVISLGNLTAGGTGKTPAALAVVRRLRERGRRPAILSRGYRGVDGVNEEALLAGDIPVVCDPDRVAGGRRACAAGADCLVLDDGFQHRRLHRDRDIVVLDATRPWGRTDGGAGAVLPLGYLREGRRGLRRADLAWISRADLIPAERLERLRRELPANLPVVIERMTEVRLTALGDGTSCAPAALTGSPVILASGIGNPAAFEALCRRTGMLPLASHRFPDHHRFTAGDLARLGGACLAAGATLVITAKDAVKLRALPGAGDLPCLVLTAEGRLDDPAPLLAVIDSLPLP